MEEKEKKISIEVDSSEETPPEREEKSKTVEITDEKEGARKDKPLETMTKKELLDRIEEIQKVSENHYDQYLRSQADIENLKKRNRRDKEEWVKYANETLIKDLLPVLDNLEFALSHSNNEDSQKAMREGLELTLKGFRDSLEKSGLETVKSTGEPFDPNFHQAVSQEEDEEMDSGMVLKELQKGYLLRERLIRPAMVVVSK